MPTRTKSGELSYSFAADLSGENFRAERNGSRLELDSMTSSEFEYFRAPTGGNLPLVISASRRSPRELQMSVFETALRKHFARKFRIYGRNFSWTTVPSPVLCF